MLVHDIFFNYNSHHSPTKTTYFHKSFGPVVEVVRVRPHDVKGARLAFRVIDCGNYANNLGLIL